jgi:NAD(P) transhydrogenase
LTVREEGAAIMNYERLVIGNGREAVDGAIASARQGQTVALVETKAVAEEAVSIEMMRQAVNNLAKNGSTSMSELRGEVARMGRCQRAADRAELECLGVDVFSGEVRFVAANTVEVRSGDDVVSFQADNVLVACGTKSARPGHIRFDGQLVVDAESLLSLDKLPESMIVVGAGETGLDYALLLGSLGVDVTVIDERTNIFEVCGGLLDEAQLSEMQSLDIAFRLGDEVIGVETRADGRAAVRLASGKVFVADAVLVCVGRVGDTESLNLEAAGVGLDERGRVWCDANGGTWASHIQAVGDVVGFRATSALAG